VIIDVDPMMMIVVVVVGVDAAAMLFLNIHLFCQIFSIFR
jgi:hypothetical protein